MGQTNARGRKPRVELLVSGIEPLPAAIAGWELELLAPILRPLVRPDRQATNDERALHAPA